MTHQLQCGKLFNVTFACRSESLTWRPTLVCFLLNWMRGYLRTSLWKRSKKGLSAECNQIRAHIPNTAFFREILWLCRKAKEEKQDFKIKSRLFSRFQEKEAETHTQIKEREKHGKDMACRGHIRPTVGSCKCLTELVNYGPIVTRQSSKMKLNIWMFLYSFSLLSKTWPAIPIKAFLFHFHHVHKRKREVHSPIVKNQINV